MQEDMPLQVALMASWHLVPAFSYLQFLQQGLFLSLWREQRHAYETPQTQRFSVYLDLTKVFRTIESFFLDLIPALCTIFECAV